ncbi:MAG: DivIVA domain-containing protein [Actinomycetaceae bacterium]|nr:DivIVA domain-containing protein [Actinomycetaceae bacterium]
MNDFFPSVGLFRKGYSKAEVDEFFQKARQAYEGDRTGPMFSSEQVRKMTFPLKRRGYDPAVVDAALDRLESAFISSERANHVAVNGEEVWLDHVADRATTLYPRLVRPVGERFSHPEPKERGYRASEVDAFLDRIASFFDDDEVLTADEVRRVTFSVAKGEDAYLEGPVDAYLSRTIDILLSIE